MLFVLCAPGTLSSGGPSYVSRTRPGLDRGSRSLSPPWVWLCGPIAATDPSPSETISPCSLGRTRLLMHKAPPSLSPLATGAFLPSSPWPTQQYLRCWSLLLHFGLSMARGIGPPGFHSLLLPTYMVGCGLVGSASLGLPVRHDPSYVGSGPAAVLASFQVIAHPPHLLPPGGRGASP